MSARTAYFTLAFNTGELKAVDQASAANSGITSADLRAAEADAMNRVNQFVVRVAGPLRGATIVADYMDDTNTLDPLVVQLAELMSAADILERWERFNRSDEGPDGQVRRRDSSDVRGRATRIAQDIMDAGGTLTTAGTFRRWYRPKGQQGPRVTGPMVSGSYFDPKGYTDPWGRLFPGPEDPYVGAH